ncbi:hypothetical protein NC77_02370 [Janthinobacterium lividum]|nr:hypothetical protein NC77_02370 [Janthinobacterium lividum]
MNNNLLVKVKSRLFINISEYLLTCLRMVANNTEKKQNLQNKCWISLLQLCTFSLPIVSINKFFNTK